MSDKNLNILERKELLKWNKKAFFVIFKRLSLKHQIKKFLWKVTVFTNIYKLIVYVLVYISITVLHLQRSLYVNFIYSEILFSIAQWFIFHLYFSSQTKFELKNI